MSTILLADIGNTRAKLALGGGGRVHRRVELPWREDFAASLADFLEQIDPPAQAWVASVADEGVLAELERGLAARFGLGAKRARVSARACGLRNAYREPARLGVDRWLGAIGAWRARGRAACVVDCGTAITVNVISDAGEYLGGSISPGLRLMHEALAERTGALPLVASGPAPWPAADTAAAIRRGCLEAAAGVAARALRRSREELSTAAGGIITGGDAERLLPMLDGEFEHRPALVLEGLLAMAEAG